MKASFSSLHLQAIQEAQLNKMIRSEILHQREIIDQLIKKNFSNIRRFCLLDTWHQNMTESQVQQYLKSSIYQREKYIIYDSPSSLPNIARDVSIKITSFLRQYGKFIPLIIKCSTFYFQEKRPLQVFNPCTSAESFFVSSTMPSLFGYGWCIEQQIAYTDSVIKIIKNSMKTTKSLNTSNFRNSFISSLIKHYYIICGVKYFLQNALKNGFSRFFSDDHYSDIAANTEKYCKTILSHAKMFFVTIRNAIDSLPLVLKYFFSEAYKITQKQFPGLENDYIEYLFFDLLIFPALINPKNYDLISEMAIPSRSPTHIINLIQFLKWSYHKDLIPSNFSTLIEMPDFNEINIFGLIDKIIAWSKIEKFEFDEGISLKHFQHITSTSYHVILMSINDVAFLLEIINKSLQYVKCDADKKRNLEGLTNFSILLKESKLTDFWYNNFIFPTINPNLIKINSGSIGNEIYLPIFPPPLQIKDEASDETITIPSTQLISYLASVPFDSRILSLKEFFNTKIEQYKEVGDIELLTKTQAMKTLMENCDEQIVLTKSLQIIRRRLKKYSKNLGDSFEQQKMLNFFEQTGNHIENMCQNLNPIFYQSIISLFFSRNKQFLRLLEAKSSVIQTDSALWTKFFQDTYSHLIEYVKSLYIVEEHFNGIGKQLHGILASQISYVSFTRAHAEYLEADEKIKVKYDFLLDNFLDQTTSAPLKRLISAPRCFDAAVSELKNVIYSGTPFEKIEIFENCVNLLDEVYGFETGGGLPGDDFLPLVTYIVIRAKIPIITSLMNYINYFFFFGKSNIELLTAEQKYILTTFICASQHIKKQANA